MYEVRGERLEVIGDLVENVRSVEIV